jgi:hypothetical protein
MTSEQLKTFRRARPFQPFAIHLADGRQLLVRHPEAAALSPSGRSVQVINADRLTEVVDMLLVISLRPLNPFELRTRR